MTIRLSSGLTLIGCTFLASCYPWQEDRGPSNKVPQQHQTAPVQGKKIEDKKVKPTRTEDLKPKNEPSITEQTAENKQETAPPEKKEEVKKTDYSFASKVPGKEGFVFSPYNNKVVDVSGIPSGTLVMDPTYSASEKKYFRVP